MSEASVITEIGLGIGLFTAVVLALVAIILVARSRLVASGTVDVLVGPAGAATTLAALPPGGRLVVSEPMTGGARPSRAGDVYFAIYTMAMGTGRARSAAEIGALISKAGFGEVRQVPTYRPYVTSVVTAVRSA